MDISILSDPQWIARRERHILRLQRLFDGNPDAGPFWLFGSEYHLDGARLESPASEVEKALNEFSSQVEKLDDPTVFRPLTFECDIFGVHFIDKIFGADVFNLDGTWQANYLSQPVGRLLSPDLEHDPAWQKARDIAEAFLAAGTALPFFGLPTIASALNVGVNLFGQELLASILSEPEAAQHDLNTINQVLISLHGWYRERLPAAQLQPVVGSLRTQPPGFGQLCGCTTQLISREQYRQFIAPLDAELLGSYPNGGMIHLCGTHLQHLPIWREMKELRAIQVNDRAAEDLKYYWHGLRDDQILYVNPTPTMTVERILSITHGHRVVIVSDR